MEKEEEVDRKRSGKTMLKSGQESTLPVQLGQLKKKQGGKGLLPSHQFCPTFQNYGIEIE